MQRRLRNDKAAAGAMKAMYALQKYVEECGLLDRGDHAEEELVNLTMAIVAINGWNRLAIGFREVPGTYRQGRKKDRPDG